MTPRLFGLTKVDRYLIGRMAPRMAIALAITLIALLMERVLRLIDLVTTQGAPLSYVVRMTVNLLPHYLGLALPATFCIAVLTLVSSMARENEIDALEGAGWSLRRIGAPFIASAMILSIVSLPLLGILQPYTRYGYREVKHAAMNAGWTGRVEEGVFIDAGDGLIISAREVDPTGRILSRVFVSQQENGAESILTARLGLVLPDPDGRVVRLVLKDGRGLVAGGWLDFEDLRLSREFAIDKNPFRPRGDSERELTFGELLTRASGEDGLPPEPRYIAEFHSRIVRAVSLIGIALLSIPLGVSRKRASVWPRLALAMVILVAYDHMLLTLKAMADLGRVPPVMALWLACAAFLAGSFWLYFMTPGQGAPSPLRAVLRRLDEVSGDLAAFVRRRLPWARSGS